MNKKLVWTGRVISTLICCMFAFNVLVKLFPQVFYPKIVEQMAGIGLPATLLPILAFLEFLCTLLYAIPQTAILGAVLFTGYLGGAMLTHLRVGQPVTMHVVFGLLVWLGIYLREPRLHALLPIRRN